MTSQTPEGSSHSASVQFHEVAEASALRGPWSLSRLYTHGSFENPEFDELLLVTAREISGIW